MDIVDYTLSDKDSTNKIVEILEKFCPTKNFVRLEILSVENYVRRIFFR